jgi:predicted lipoprotein with Yx(FWY)xxD motif
MKRVILVVSMAFVLLVSACAGPQAAAPTSAPATLPPTGQPATLEPTAQATSEVPVTGTGTSVELATSDTLGPLLVDEQGMTLYLFTKDEPGTSNCYDNCAVNWPPLLTEGEPVAGAGLDASLLGTTQRTDGTTQVTYNGWPLYYYFKDKQPGDTTGQEVGGVWFVVAPSGKAGPEAAAAPTGAVSTLPAPTSAAPTVPPAPY